MSTDTTRRRNVHPFPARMAPEIAMVKIDELTDRAGTVLDPMCGSGTVPRLALEKSRRAIACDIDPLAVMMTRTSCKPAWSLSLARRAESVVAEAKLLDDELPSWIVEDSSSIKFVEFWFADDQRRDLSRLARILYDRPTTDDPLRVALSRTIITKEGGASRARDTSHSRPHRVRDDNDFGVYDGFVRAASQIEALMFDVRLNNGSTSIRSVDAREMYFVDSESVDLILTSPPYLNAIDYLRGHRMSLVWLGSQMSVLRDVRGTSIGAERALINPLAPIVEISKAAIPDFDQLGRREQGMVWRFAHDIDRLCTSFARVVKPTGHLVFVVADSSMRGIAVSNSAVCTAVAARNGFHLANTETRELPAQHRYLPPPHAGDSTFNGRMRNELVLTYSRTG